MHGQPPIFGFQNTNESKETPDEQLGLPASGGLRNVLLACFGEEGKEWFRNFKGETILNKEGYLMEWVFEAHQQPD